MTSRVSEAKAPFGKPQSDDGKNVAGARVKVMVVDDSAVVRGLIGRILKSDAQIEVVASVGNGEAAVATLKKNPEIDVIVLDIEMPVMDGLTALPLLLQVSPSVRVIVASTLSQRGAEISLRALEAGASDYLPKPSSAAAVASADDFRRELLQKVCELALVPCQICIENGGAANGLRVAPAQFPAADQNPWRGDGTAAPSLKVGGEARDRHRAGSRTLGFDVGAAAGGAAILRSNAHQDHSHRNVYGRTGGLARGPQ